jgi:tRNA A37 threonylcarbamoyladenosine synthetase subunit TsaC/SUA5/YrdC
MKTDEATKVILSGDIEFVSRWLRQGKPAVLPFGGGRMYGLFGLQDTDPLNEMARIKGRDKKKPFVVTTHNDFLENILKHNGLSPDITKKARQRIYDLLSTSSKKASIGVLIPADSEKLHEHLIGTINIGQQIVPTIGLMVSGPDYEFKEILSNFEDQSYCLAGTSMNKSNDKKSRGSAHHKISGILQQFQYENNLCIYVPHYLFERKGPSTSMVYINHRGDEAHILRSGSISIEDMMKYLHLSGIKKINVSNTGVKNVQTYNYSLLELTRMWFHHKYLLYNIHHLKFRI